MTLPAAAVPALAPGDVGDARFPDYTRPPAGANYHVNVAFITEAPPMRWLYEDAAGRGIGSFPTTGASSPRHRRTCTSCTVRAIVAGSRSSSSSPRTRRRAGSTACATTSTRTRPTSRTCRSPPTTPSPATAGSATFCSRSRKVRSTRSPGSSASRTSRLRSAEGAAEFRVGLLRRGRLASRCRRHPNDAARRRVSSQHRRTDRSAVFRRRCRGGEPRSVRVLSSAVACDVADLRPHRTPRVRVSSRHAAAHRTGAGRALRNRTAGWELESPVRCGAAGELVRRSCSSRSATPMRKRRARRRSIDRREPASGDVCARPTLALPLHLDPDITVRHRCSRARALPPNTVRRSRSRSIHARWQRRSSSAAASSTCRRSHAQIALTGHVGFRIRCRHERTAIAELALAACRRYGPIAVRRHRTIGQSPAVRFDVIATSAQAPWSRAQSSQIGDAAPVRTHRSTHAGRSARRGCTASLDHTSRRECRRAPLRTNRSAASHRDRRYRGTHHRQPTGSRCRRTGRSAGRRFHQRPRDAARRRLGAARQQHDLHQRSAHRRRRLASAVRRSWEPDARLPGSR